MKIEIPQLYWAVLYLHYSDSLIKQNIKHVQLSTHVYKTCSIINKCELLLAGVGTIKSTLKSDADSVYDEFCKAVVRQGAVILDSTEKQALQDNAIEEEENVEEVIGSNVIEEEDNVEEIIVPNAIEDEEDLNWN